MKKFYYFHKISSKNINLFYTYSYGFPQKFINSAICQVLITIHYHYHLLRY